MRKIIYVILFLIFIVIILPAAVSYLYRLGTDTEGSGQAYSSIDEYIVSVVAAEMPALFETEALKAQAVAARTYAIYHNFEIDSYENIGQAYISEEQRKTLWGDKFTEYEAKVRKAVFDTAGEILVYDGKEINAVFHSMSAGMTESGKNAWSVDLAYLQTVDSPLEEGLSGFVSEKTVTLPVFLDICANERTDFIFEPSKITVRERSNAGYVLIAEIGNQSFTGAELRRMFNLKSSCFDISYGEGELVFTVKGYGHGAGMSQNGANEMAKNGALYTDILLHYYTGVEVVR